MGEGSDETVSVSMLARLSAWYQAQCDEEWEHSYGVTVATLDNPGWLLKVDLKATYLCERAFERIHVERTEDDWISARREGDVFTIAGGPLNLEEMIGVFLDWAEPR